jgi:hypothetical protein
MDLGVQAIPQFLQQAYQSIGATTAIDQAVKARQIGAAQATAVSPLALQASYQMGAGNVGAIQTGQALSQFGNLIGGIGGQALGYQMQRGMLQDQLSAQKDFYSSIAGARGQSGSYSPGTFGGMSSRFNLGVDVSSLGK